MEQFWSDYGVQIMAYFFTLVGAVVSFLVVFFNSKKAKLELNTQLIEKEKENYQLQRAIIDGSYVICPNCGTKIFLKDAKVYTQEVNQ